MRQARALLPGRRSRARPLLPGRRSQARALLPGRGSQARALLPGRRALLLALLLPLAACGGGDGETRDTRLTVLAAASLTEVFERLEVEFERAHRDTDVVLGFGSSTELAEQAADGAPGDVLATADRRSMQIAVDAGVAVEPLRQFAANSLVLVTPPDDPAGVDSLRDLDGSAWVRCADEVPCGRVALAVLGDAGVEAEPASLEVDVKAVMEKVASGEADAGLVYASDARSAGGAVEVVPLPGTEAHRTTYVLAALAQTSQGELADEWIALVTSPTGRRILHDAGFSVP